MKTCSTCDELKSVHEFHANRSAKDGMAAACKSCTSVRRKAEYAANPDAAKLRSSLRRAQLDREEQRLYKQGWYALNADRIRHRERARRYGLEPAAFRALLDMQHNLCPICALHLTDEDIVVDHDHGCCEGKFGCASCVRGLLHRNCNVGLGMFGDSVPNLVRAAEYLLRQRRS